MANETPSGLYIKSGEHRVWLMRNCVCGNQCRFIHFVMAPRGEMALYRCTQHGYFRIPVEPLE